MLTKLDLNHQNSLTFEKNLYKKPHDSSLNLYKINVKTKSKQSIDKNL